MPVLAGEAVSREECGDKVDYFHFGTRPGESRPRIFWLTADLDWRDLEAGTAGGTEKHSGDPVELRWDDGAENWRLTKKEA